ncbi:MAG: peptide-methionine (R)-S-oxide reductase MsrB [Cytophagales bacterium]
MQRLLILTVLLAAVGCQGQTKKAATTSTAVDTIKKIVRSEAEWKKILTPEEYHILREKGTDRPFAGKYYLTHEKGVYKCAACGNELFTSDMKFDSDCGWPSFDKEIEGGKIVQQIDRSYGMVRTEILCGKCGSHLGHLFDDGPTLTGKRYCVNSTSINLVK